MTKKVFEPSAKDTRIQYLSDSDLHPTMPFCRKFAATPERRKIYKGILGQKNALPVVVSKEGHPIVFLLVRRERKYATVLILEELMIGTFDKKLAGKVADFLTVDYLVCAFESLEEAEGYGTHYGFTNYTCDFSNPAARKSIGIDVNGNHPTLPLRFSVVTANQFDTYPPALLESMSRLGLAGMYEELHYDDMKIHDELFERAKEGGLTRWFKRELKCNRRRHMVVWHIDDRKIVGMVTLETKNPFNGKDVAIRGLSIAPEYRRMGYGRLLLQYAMSHLDARAVNVTADVLYGNIGSRKIFEGVGYFKLTEIERGSPRLVNGYYRTGVTLPHYLNEEELV